MGDLFTLSPETAHKLNLDSEDRVHIQLTRINCRVFLVDLNGERRTQGRRRGLVGSWAFGDPGKADRRISWTFSITFWMSQVHMILSDS